MVPMCFSLRGVAWASAEQWCYNWQRQASHKWGKKWSGWNRTNRTGSYGPVKYSLSCYTPHQCARPTAQGRTWQCLCNILFKILTCNCFIFSSKKIIGGILCHSIQSVVGSQLLLVIAPLSHIKTQLRELRYSSGVTQGLSQLGGWGQCAEQMEGGTLTLPLLCAQVRHRKDYNYKH